MPRKYESMSEEDKRLRSEWTKKQWAEGRGNLAGIQSLESRKKVALKKTGVKRPELCGEKHWLWKGENAGYVSKYMWLNLHFKKTGICEICQKNCGIKFPKGTEWANISDKYLRDRKDYYELCRSCHRLYDYAKLNLIMIYALLIRFHGLIASHEYVHSDNYGDAPQTSAI